MSKSEEQPTSSGASFSLDGADPPSLRFNNDSAVEPIFNPLKYNLPTRLHNPLTTSASTPNPTSSVFLVSQPTALQIRIFLDDISEVGRDYGMSEGEKIGMALYYADRDSRLLWKRMVRSADGKGWVKFRDDVLSFYPDAFVDMGGVRKTLEAFTRTDISHSIPGPTRGLTAYLVGAKQVREYIIGYLRILEDITTRMGLSDRQLCMKFVAGLPGSDVNSHSGRKTSKQGDSGSWKERLAKRIREKHPELADEFDCLPEKLFWYAFWVWRDKWIEEAKKNMKAYGF